MQDGTIYTRSVISLTHPSPPSTFQPPLILGYRESPVIGHISPFSRIQLSSLALLPSILQPMGTYHHQHPPPLPLYLPIQDPRVPPAPPATTTIPSTTILPPSHQESPPLHHHQMLVTKWKRHQVSPQSNLYS